MTTTQARPIADQALSPASWRDYPALVRALILVCAAPLVGELMFHALGSEVRWVSIPVHAVVEALGFFAGVILATLLIMLRRYNSAYAYHLWTALGLVVMGTLDGLHSVSMPSQTFVWLHSIATLGGGILFSMVWLPAPTASWIRDRWIIGMTLAGAVCLGAASMLWPSMLPLMVTDKGFTALAIAVNFVGGSGFLAAVVWFLSRQRQALSIDDYLFAVLSLLFGMSGVFFGMSKLWEIEWWFWHLLRLLAYLLVLGQTFRFYKQNLDEIQANVLRHQHLQHLEELVAERTTELKASETELRESRDKLEERVRARTAELQAANAALFTEKGHQDALIKKLEEAHNQLLQSEKMASIGQLAAGIAHEINNPVGFVNSNLGTLKRYVDDLLGLIDLYERCEAEHAVHADQLAAVKQAVELDFLRKDVVALLDESREGLERVKKIVQDLKDFSHVDEAEWQEADLNAGMESTLNVVWNELKYKAEVKKDYGELPPVRCIPGQLNQVFMNLLVNAAHAIDGRGTITLRTRQVGEEVWIEVADTGSGIAPENLKRIFKPFFTTKPVGKGTGLGLSLSYGIVQKHHGRIEVSSEQGKGTTFRIILPVRAGSTGLSPAAVSY